MSSDNICFIETREGVEKEKGNNGQWGLYMKGGKGPRNFLSYDFFHPAGIEHNHAAVDRQLRADR